MKVDLSTHLRHNNGHLFLWYLELFRPSFKVGQTKVENMHFCRLSRNWNFKVNLDTRLRDKHKHLFLFDLELFWPAFKVGQPRLKKCTFVDFIEIEFWKCRIPIWKISMGTYFYDIWSYFGTRSRFFKLRLKICTFYFILLELSFKSRFRYRFER